MTQIPPTIGEAHVLAYTIIDERNQPTGACKHVAGGEPFGPAAGLAICQYPGENGYYLFYCTTDWEVVTDTWHESIEDAKDQAEFEYTGTLATWLPTA